MSNKSVHAYKCPALILNTHIIEIHMHNVRHKICVNSITHVPQYSIDEQTNTEPCG